MTRWRLTTSYRLVFDRRARKEFEKLDVRLRKQFQKKLAERLRQPRVEADRLSGTRNGYRLKARSAGYRLVYEVQDDRLVVLVVAVAKRDAGKRDVFDLAQERMQQRERER